MTLFKDGFGFKRLLVELRRIANALEVIALYHAKLDGRMWTPSFGRIVERHDRKSGESAEILHTNDEDMLVHQLRDQAEFQNQGWGEDE